MGPGNKAKSHPYINLKDKKCFLINQGNRGKNHGKTPPQDKHEQEIQAILRRKIFLFGK